MAATSRRCFAERRGAATRGGAFPLGITRLDRNGNVLFNDKAEARFANRRAEETVGLNYFREVAPCTAVKHFQARFRADASRRSYLRRSFHAREQHAHVRVRIQLDDTRSRRDLSSYPFREGLREGRPRAAL
jgi:photoactive yellow protein